MVKRISFAFRTDSLAQRISDECVLTNDCLVNGVTLDWIAWRGGADERGRERGSCLFFLITNKFEITRSSAAKLFKSN